MSTEAASSTPIPPLPPAKREASKVLLRVIVKSSIAATRSLEPHVVDQDRASRMNALCAEFLYFHMWRAFKRARVIMGPEAYRSFRDYAVHGLAVVAAGCFTGLYDKAAQRRFLENMQAAFTVYGRCGPELISSADVMTSNDQLPAVARAAAELAGWGGDPKVVMKIIIAGLESFNATRVDDAVDDVFRA